METFSLDILHNGKQHTIHGSLLQLGYTHKIYLDVEGVEVVLEPDEERNYRAVVTPELADKVNKELIAFVIEEIQKHLG
jgi:hypothetical protein